MKPLLLITILALMFQQAPAFARTWTVRKDGAGDFSVIQDAIDSASEGDVIDIGPGRYTEFTSGTIGYAWYDAHAYIGVNNLTFVGAGPTETIIGPYHIDDLENYSYGIAHASDYDVTVKDIGFINLSGAGVIQYLGHLTIENCVFENVENGIKGMFSRGADIVNCNFLNSNSNGIYVLPSENVKIEGCELSFCSLGVYFDNCSGFEVKDCVLTNCGTGVSVYTSSSGELRSCTLRDSWFAGVVFDLNGYVEMTDNTIESDLSRYGVYFRTLGNLSITNNTISTNSNTLYFNNAAIDNFHFHNNHLFRGNGNFVMTAEQHPWDYHVDLTNNYWGTTDLEEIAEYIFDGNDFPGSDLIIDFAPIADGPVPTESTTLEGIKAMYR